MRASVEPRSSDGGLYDRVSLRKYLEGIMTAHVVLRSLRVSVLVAFCALFLLELPTLGQQKSLGLVPQHRQLSDTPLQPLAQQVRRLEDAMNYLGQPFSVETHRKINKVLAMQDEAAAVAQLQQLLDPYVLAEVNINPESRVKVTPGAADPALVEKGTRLFLVKVINEAGVRAPLNVESPNTGPTSLSYRSSEEHEVEQELTESDVRERWAEISMYQRPPMWQRLTGLGVEYQVLSIYSRDRGKRSAKIAFNVGQGSQDIGFRNDMLVLFDIAPTRPITLRVKDENGQPTIAGFKIRDRAGRIYPNPSKRLAPDFPFQAQVYRADGEKVLLPAGYYTMASSGGPEFHVRTREFSVDSEGPNELAFQLQRWINPSKYGWWSGDHHIHASGCAHYKNPTEGVQPVDMLRQVLGEHLNIGSVLTWGPSWYYQKQFFSGEDNDLSKPERLLHYDVEVSGFPSSHAGHLVLLGLKEDDYPGTKRVEQWPSWDLPILQWAQSQDAIVGFTHSGWGLQVQSDELPNYEMPSFDGIGANEYIVDVTHNAVDFISLVDTPSIWELNIWYHTLNAGFRTRVSGETDFPCIYDERVGMGRSYVKLKNLTYRNWIEGVRDGRTYVGDGKSHLIDFQLNGVEVGTQGSEVRIGANDTVRVEVKAAALLDRFPDPKFYNYIKRQGRSGKISQYDRLQGKLSSTPRKLLPYDVQPYWDVERARITGTRDVSVELVINGEAIAEKRLTADGRIRDLVFEVPIAKSSWVALRILPSSHTNPIFVIVDGKPIRASRRSAEWCLAAVNQCWTQKIAGTRESEKKAAKRAYDHARAVYKQRIVESK